MSEKKETVADIVREIREHDGEITPPFVCFAEDGGLCMNGLADRIEAAWKRELNAAPARNCDRFADANKAYGGYLDEGNEGEIDSANFLAWLFAPAKKEVRDGE